MGNDPRISNAASDEAEMASNAEAVPVRRDAGREHAERVAAPAEREAAEPSGTTKTNRRDASGKERAKGGGS